MPWQYIDKTGLTSRADLAKKLNINDSTLFGLIQYQRLIPEPTTKVGLRYFYDEKQYMAVAKIVADLRKAGRLK